jgi:hypothetical protein
MPETLAARQLDAYNRADLDAFCACYHPDVVMLDGDGAVDCEGRPALRERYAALFATGGFGATVSERIVVGRHCVDRELWWRSDPDTGARSEGLVLVRYTVKDGLIAVAQFFEP